MKYNRTSLAYQTEEIEAEDPKIKTYKNKKINNKNKFTRMQGFLCLFYVLILCGSLLIKNADLSTKNAELSAIKKEYNDLLNENKKIELSINSQIDLKKVEEIALTRLKMNRPLKNQTIYISSQPKDYGEIVTYSKDETEKPENRNVLASIFNAMTSAKAYSK